MKRADFVFTVGFHGDTAVVDRQLRAKYAAASPEALLDAGLTRAAFCAVVYDAGLDTTVPGAAGPAEQSAPVVQFRRLFAERTGLDLGLDEMSRLFGVFRVPTEIRSFLYV